MIRWFAKHPTASNLLMLGLIMLGLKALPGLQRESLPAISNDKVRIQIIYRGATPGEVEDAVCRRVEDALESITDLDEMRCEAVEGMATITAVMQEGAEMQRFLDDVNAEINAIKDFPDDIETPVISELGRTDKVISMAISGPEDPVILKAWAEDLKDRLLSHPQYGSNIADINISGFSRHQIRIEIPAQRLREFGLSAADIANTVKRHSISSPGGKLEGGSEDVLLRFDEQRKTVAELRELVVISAHSGASIRLGEIASITDRFDRDEVKILFNGKRAAILNITKTKSQDILEANHAVRQFVEEERNSAPRGVEITLTQDVSSNVQGRLDMLLRNGVQGLLMVFAMLWLFFSLRYSFWVTMGLPISFMGALFILPLIGVTINMISMVGLLIGIGLLMDDAIVIAENIASRMRKGDTPIHAAIEGTRQVFPGIASSFATTLMVFGSLAFINGEMGQILRVMPIVLIVVLSVSLLEAFLVLPNHLGHSLSHMKKRKDSRFRQSFERGFDTLRERLFGPLLDLAVDFRYLTLGLVIMAIIIAIAVPASGKLKFVGFPKLDGDVLEARLLLPQGTPLARTEAIVKRIQTAISDINKRHKDQQPDGVNLVRNVMVIFGENPDAYESGPHVARIVVDLLSAEQRTTTLDTITSEWRSAVGQPPDVISIKYTEPNFLPGGRPIDIRFTGEDFNELKAASHEFQQWLNSYQGVLDVSDDLRPGKREIRLRLKQAAGVMGLDARSIADQIKGSFQGIKVDEFPLGTENYEVNLRLSAADRMSVSDLDALTITGRNGAQLPLSVVAEQIEVRGWARIHRVDGKRAVTIQGDVDRDIANAEELISIAKQQFFPDLQTRYPGISLSIEGASADSKKTGESIIGNVLAGMIGVYLLLALQFRGYLAPLAVMIVIPTALIGVIFGHLAQGLDLTMPSMIGMASLFGVVVNDSILLVVFIREAAARGVAITDAAKQAGRARFRPILLTSVTTIAGLAPLLTETSLQAQILIPLANSLAFGLTSATLIALFLVPALYAILDDFGVATEREDEHDNK